MHEPRKPDIVLEELGELLISTATEKLSIWKDRLPIYANKKQWNESEKAEYINSLKKYIKDIEDRTEDFKESMEKLNSKKTKKNLELQI